MDLFRSNTIFSTACRYSEATVAEEVIIESKKTGLVIPKLNPWLLVIPAIALVLAVGTYYARPLVIAATVNNQPISRLDLIQELEKQGGKQTLDALITKSLIAQEAKKQNVQISNEEVDQEITRIETNLSQQGQKLDDILLDQGMTREKLRGDIALQKTAEQLGAKDVTVTEEEINEYLEQNKDIIPQNLSQEEIRTNISEQLLEQKKSQAIQSWISSLYSGANITYYVNY